MNIFDPTQDSLLSQELETARLQLEADGRGVLVVGVTLEGGVARLGRSVTVPLSSAEGLTLAAVLQHEVDRLRRVAAGPKGGDR